MKHFEHKIIQGAGAGKWLPFARQKVAALHARAKAQRVTDLVQRFTVEGGDVEVAVRVVGDQRYIHIRRKSCPPFASGLADAILNPIFSTYPLVPLLPLVEITPQGDPNPRFALRRFFPSARDAGDTPRAFHDEPRLARNVEAAKQILSNLVVPIVRSGQFTAEMRKVVQVLQGMNEVVTYRPLYALTHGVFVSADGTRWVVEVTVNGVVAWVMNVCTAQQVTAENGTVLLPYTPLPSPKPKTEDIPAAIAAGTFKVLADAATVLEFFTKTPFFAECGWAFNRDGHLASNVCFYFENFTTRSSLYTITITEQDNAPVSATMARVEDGYLFGTKLVHMKYPLPDGKLYSFDTTAPVPVVSSAPIYCWYDGDKFVVARYEYTPGTNTTTVNEGGSLTNPCSSELNRDLHSGTFTQINSPSISIAGLATPTRMHNYSGSIVRTDLGGTIGGLAANFSVFGGMAHFDYFDGRIYSRAGAVDTQGVRATMIVPSHEREAVYIAVENESSITSGSITVGARFASTNERHFSECIETCVADPDRCVNLIAGVGGLATPPNACFGGAPGELWQFSTSADLYDGGVTGSVINTSIQDGAGCAATQVSHLIAPPDTVIFPGTVVTKDYSFDFVASDGGSGPLPLPTAPVYLVAFIDEGETQRAVAFRDAFEGQRYIISSNVLPELIPFITRDDAGYPLQEIHTSPAWIGVP